MTSRTPGRRTVTSLRWASAGVAVLLLTACGNNDMSDLREFIKQTKQREGGRIEPIPEMETFETYRYPEDPGRNPFTTLSFAEPREDQADQGGQASSGPSPDRDRPQEPLEEFALDSLSYVGTLQQDGELWALIKDPAGTVHRVQTGDYMGTNYGKIQSITPQSIQLRELVKDQQSGGWRKQETSLALDEGATGS